MEKKPWKAFILSLIYPGLGHLYAGKTLFGILFIVITSLGLIKGILDNELSRIIILIGGYWFLIAGIAALSANKYNLKFKSKKNESDQQNSLLCPQCQTRLPLDSKECGECHEKSKEVLFYENSSERFISSSNFEINNEEIVEYKKGLTGKRNGKTERFSDIYEANLENSLIDPYIYFNFKYKDEKGTIKKKSLLLNKYHLKNLKNALDVLNIPFKDTRRKK